MSAVSRTAEGHCDPMHGQTAGEPVPADPWQENSGLHGVIATRAEQDVHDGKAGVRDQCPSVRSVLFKRCLN